MRYLVDFAQLTLKTRRVDARSAKEARWRTLELQKPSERSVVLITGVRTTKRRRPKGN